MVSGRKAAFIDRDGVLNEDHGYVSRPEDFHWIAGAVDALARLQAAGFALVVVTNQSGIARGFYTQADFDALTAHISAELREKFKDVIPVSIPVFPGGDWEKAINEGWYRAVAPNVDPNS